MIESNIEGVTLKLQTGKTPPSKEEKYFNGDINWYTPADLKTKLLGRSKRTITELAYIDKKALIYPRGTVLLSCIGDIGKLGITTDDKSSSNQQITGLIPDTTKITSEYLYYWCLAHKYVFESKGTSVTVPMLNNKRLRKIKISYTKSIDDQIKIANLLSQVEALIAKREESINLLDELLRSTFLDMFGRYDKLDYRLEELCSEIVDCPHSTPKYSDNKTEFLCLRTSEFSNGQIDYSSMKYVNEEEYLKRIKRLIPEFGDVLYAREGSYGDAVRVPKELLICLGQRTMLFRPKIEICNSTFLWALVRSDMVFRQAKKKNKGATVGRVNVKDIKDFKVFLPPKPLQDKFATIVQQVEESKKRYQESLNQLHQLFGSLSQRAFKGELNLDKMKNPVAVKISDATFLDAPSSSGAGDILEFTRKENIDKHTKIVEKYTDDSGRSMYSEDFLWMVLSQADDDISYESIATKLKLYDFKEQPSYDDIQADVFLLIEKAKLEQTYDDTTKKIVLSRIK